MQKPRPLWIVLTGRKAVVMMIFESKGRLESPCDILYCNMAVYIVMQIALRAVSISSVVRQMGGGMIVFQPSHVHFGGHVTCREQ